MQTCSNRAVSGSAAGLCNLQWKRAAARLTPSCMSTGVRLELPQAGALQDGLLHQVASAALWHDHGAGCERALCHAAAVALLTSQASAVANPQGSAWHTAVSASLLPCKAYAINAPWSTFDVRVLSTVQLLWILQMDRLRKCTNGYCRCGSSHFQPHQAAARRPRAHHRVRGCPAGAARGALPQAHHVLPCHTGALALLCACWRFGCSLPLFKEGL